MLATEVRTGDAPKPTFSMKTDEKSKKSGNQPPRQPYKFRPISESADCLAGGWLGGPMSQDVMRPLARLCAPYGGRWQPARFFWISKEQTQK